MRILPLIVLFTLAATASAQARLGENADQLVARYGEPLAKIDQKAEAAKVALIYVNFQKNGFEIDVTFSEGISVAESFKKLNGDVLTIEEIRTLLADNAQGYSWESPQIINEQKQWTRDDGSVATLTGLRVLTITSKELLGEEASARKLEHAPSLDGF